MGFLGKSAFLEWGNESARTGNTLRVMRVLHILEVVVYASWWFIIHYTEPSAYNPVDSRILVVGLPLVTFLLSYRSTWVQKHIEPLYYMSLYVLMTHNQYAKHLNYNSVSWPMANYITVAAVCACFQSGRALFYFSLYTFALGFYIASVHNFMYDFYVPGLITIIFVMNLNLFFRNRALHQLAETKVRFEKLFNAVFEGIALHEKGKIIALNESFANLFGSHRDDLLGTSVLNLVSAESLDVVHERMSNSLETPYEVWAKKVNGKIFPVEISIKRHVYEGREVRMIAVRDMSERHQVESERKKKLEAQAAVELRDQFISIASHELRTPLTPLKLSNEILSQMMQEKHLSALSEPQVLKMIKASGAQIGRITRLIDDMLDVSRMSAGHFELRLEDFDLAEVIDNVLTLHSDDIVRSRSKVTVRHQGAVDVCWDRLRIEQVFTNLLKNSLVYGNGKPITISLRTTKTNVVLIVRDHGIGIPSDKVSRIFNRFERAVSSKNYGGLGLGLYIARQIVKAHQGRITVKSTFERGSRFAVVIPRLPEVAFVSFMPELYTE